jgi:hypothetical protein
MIFYKMMREHCAITQQHTPTSRATRTHTRAITPQVRAVTWALLVVTEPARHDAHRNARSALRFIDHHAPNASSAHRHTRHTVKPCTGVVPQRLCRLGCISAQIGACSQQDRVIFMAGVRFFFHAQTRNARKRGNDSPCAHASSSERNTKEFSCLTQHQAHAYTVSTTGSCSYRNK